MFLDAKAWDWRVTCNWDWKSSSPWNLPVDVVRLLGRREHVKSSPYVPSVVLSECRSSPWEQIWEMDRFQRRICKLHGPILEDVTSTKRTGLRAICASGAYHFLPKWTVESEDANFQNQALRPYFLTALWLLYCRAQKYLAIWDGWVQVQHANGSTRILSLTLTSI